MSVDISKILTSLSKFKMISVRLLRGVLNPSAIGSVGSNALPVGPQQQAGHDNNKPRAHHQPSAAHLSTSDHASQAAPLLTPRSQKIKEKLRENNADLPNKPKKPETPWISFLRDNKDRYLGGGRRMRVSELTSLMAKEWQSVDKTNYLRQYKKRHDEYKREMALYEKSLTDEQRAVIKSQKNLKRESKAMKLLRATKPPILPRNSANMYCVDRCKDDDIRELMKTKQSSLVLKDLFADYRRLTDAEKEKYIELQQKDKLRFQQEFNQWYDSIKSEPKLTKSAHEKANLLHARFKALNWI